MNILPCPQCQAPQQKVIDSRPEDHRIRRRRQCLQCGHRFTTYEEISDRDLPQAAPAAPEPPPPPSPIRELQNARTVLQIALARIASAEKLIHP